ncbi:MAG: DNRLRE domain-containing protein [Promethearchaeota archaeon]
MKKKLVSLSFLLLFTLLSIGTVPVYAASKKSIITDADTYIDDAHPSSNYGSEDSLHVATSDFISEINTYLHFDLSGRPNNMIKTEIKISVVLTPIPFYLSIFLVTGVWDEYLLTWNNKPSLGQKIADLIYNGDGDIIINILFTGDDISICLKTISSQDGILWAHSRESIFPPELIWTYKSDSIEGFPVFLLLISVLGCILLMTILTKFEYNDGYRYKKFKMRGINEVKWMNGKF